MKIGATYDAECHYDYKCKHTISIHKLDLVYNLLFDNE
jgi:hypothetical protein